MLSVLDMPTKYPAIWLGAFALGSAMSVAAIGFSMGTVAAGYTAGFLALAGTFGYEILSRRRREVTLLYKIKNIENEQKRIAHELLETRNDVDGMKDDMVTATRAMANDGKKSGSTQTVIRSFERIGNRARASFMPKEPPANTSPIFEPVKAPIKTSPSPVDAKVMRAQKYKDLLLNQKEEEDIQATEKIAPEYTEAVLSELINQAVQNDKIEIFAQPIVKLPSRRLRYLELYARIRAKTGIYLSGQSYRSLAEKEALIENVDHLLLVHTIDMIRNDARRKFEIGYFINISSRSLKDTVFMNDLLEFVRTRRDLCSRLVLEFQHADFQTIAPPIQRIVDGLTRIGCVLSVDNIDNANINIDSLAERGVSFLKFNAQKILMNSTSYEGEMAMMRMKSSLDRAGIVLIVEKIEDNHALKELLDFEFDFGEGHLFGRPDLEMAYRPKRAAS